MYNYLIHGAALASNRLIHGLPSARFSKNPVLTLRFHDLGNIVSQKGESLSVSFNPPLDDGLKVLRTSTWCLKTDLLMFRYATNGLIDIGWKHQTEEGLESLDRIFLTHVLGNLVAIGLRLQGNIVLHGNAVNLAGRSVAWLGSSGAGKSTLSAAMFDAGHDLITDDQMVLINQNDKWHPAYGVPRVRLAPWSIEKMGPKAKSAFNQPMVSTFKGWLDMGNQRDVKAPPSLSAVYVLGPRLASAQKPRIIPIESPGEKLRNFIFHRFCGRTLQLSSKQYAFEFKSLATLANDVPTYLLQLPDQLALASQAVRALEEHNP